MSSRKKFRSSLVLAHGTSTSTDFGAPAGRVGLSEQLRGLGWRGAAGECTRLLNSLRFGASFNWW